MIFSHAKTHKYAYDVRRVGIVDDSHPMFSYVYRFAHQNIIIVRRRRSENFVLVNLVCLSP